MSEFCEGKEEIKRERENTKNGKLTGGASAWSIGGLSDPPSLETPLLCRGSLAEQEWGVYGEHSVLRENKDSRNEKGRLLPREEVRINPLKRTVLA